MPDGSITIGAGIEEKGFDKALDRLERSMGSSAKSMEKDFSSAGKGIENAIDIVQKKIKLFTDERNNYRPTELIGIRDAIKDIDVAISDINVEPTKEGIRQAEKELANLEKQYEKVAQATLEAKESMDFFTDGGKIMNDFTKDSVDEFNALNSATNIAAQGLGKYEDAIAAAKDEMATAKQASADYKEEQKQVAKAQSDAEKQTRALESAMNIFVTKVLAQAISSMDRLVESTYDFRKEIAFVETNLANMGADLGKSEEYMARFAVVSSNTRQNMSAVSDLLNTGFDENEMLTAIDSISGAVIAFPDLTVKRIGESIQRTFGSGEAVFAFAELINRTGGDVDKFNEKMARANTDTAKQRIILQELNRMGLSETLELYREMNPEMVTASEVAYDLAAAEAELGEALQPIKNEIDEAKAAILGMVADFVKANPEVSAMAIGFAYAGTAIMGVLTAVSLMKNIFGGLPSLFGGTAKSAGDVAKNVSSAGNSASGANMKFLSMAAGIAVVAVGLAALVAASSLLAKALGDTDAGALETAASVAIVVTALTGMITAVTALNKLFGNNTSGMLIYAASITIIATAASIMIGALAGLVEVMGDSGSNMFEIAGAITAVIAAMTIFISVIAVMAKVTQNSMGSLMIFVGVLGAIAAMFLAIAAAMDAMNRASSSAGQMRSAANTQGHARGTQSAASGWKWVGENGPELMRFTGGERVLNAHQSMARQNALVGGARTTIRNTNVTFTIPADQVRSFARLVDMAESEYVQIMRGVDVSAY